MAHELFIRGDNMMEYYFTVKEDGEEYALQVAEELRSKGYEVLSINEAMVPRGKNTKVPGYRIVVDDGRPPYISRITGYMVYGESDF